MKRDVPTNQPTALAFSQSSVETGSDLL